MTNTEIRKANVKTLRAYAKKHGVDVDGMTRADIVDALLGHGKKNESKPVNTVKLVVMVSPNGIKANVHPDMVEEYRLNGGFKEV